MRRVRDTGFPEGEDTHGNMLRGGAGASRIGDQYMGTDVQSRQYLHREER